MAELVTIDVPPEADGHAVNGKPAAVNEPTSAAPAVTPPAAFSLRRNVKQLPPISAFLCVALGGALGALLRYGFIQACVTYQTSSTTSTAPDGTTIITLHKPFPLSTFISNMLGCLLIGLLSILLPALLPSPTRLLHCRSLLVTGFLGALTTMSSFVLDSAELWENQSSRRQGESGVVVVQDGDGRQWVGVVYWVVTNVGGIGMVVIGRAVARWVERRYWRGVVRKADMCVSANGQKKTSDAERAVAREAEAEHKEQAMVEVGESIDAESDKR